MRERNASRERRRIARRALARTACGAGRRGRHGRCRRGARRACLLRLGGARRRRRAAGGRRAGRFAGALTACVDELVERQIQHVVASLAVDEHLRGARVDLLHRVQVHALTNHGRSLRIFCVDLLEALGIALRLRHHAIAVGARLVDRARRIGLRARQQLVRVGLRRVAGALVVLAHLRRFLERRLHLRGHLHALQRDARHLKARLVGIERALDRVDETRAQGLAILVEQVVGGLRAGDLADRGLRPPASRSGRDRGCERGSRSAT